MSRLIYKIIKIFQNIVIIILLFYVTLYKNSATKFEYRVLYDIHDLPCSTFKIFYQHGGDHVACGTLGHAIKHGEVKGSHITLNVQHYSTIKLH